MVVKKTEEEVLEIIRYQIDRTLFPALKDIPHWIYDSELGQYLAEEYDEQECDFEFPSGRRFDIVWELKEVTSDEDETTSGPSSS